MKKLIQYYQKQTIKNFKMLKDKKNFKKQIPNLLTFSRLLAPFIIIPLAIYNHVLLALLFAVLFAMTDLLDGYYARKHHAVSEFGKEIDPICDKVFVGGVLISLIVYQNKLIYNVIIELLIAIIIVYFRKNDKKTSVSFLGKIKTAFLYILISYNFLDLFLNSNLNVFNILFYICLTLQLLTLILYVIKYRTENYEENKHTLAYKILKPIVIGIFKLYFNPKIMGKENIPKDGSIIVSGNHINVHDQFLVIAGTKRMIHYMAKKEYFEGKMAFFFEMVGCIPVDRSIKDEVAKKTAIDILKNKGALGIFPEGTRNKTKDLLLPFKYGAVSMAQKTNAKIIPFGISGEYKFRSQTLTVHIGKPYAVGDDLEKANQELKEIITNLMFEGRKK